MHTYVQTPMRPKKQGGQQHTTTTKVTCTTCTNHALFDENKYNRLKSIVVYKWCRHCRLSFHDVRVSFSVPMHVVFDNERENNRGCIPRAALPPPHSASIHHSHCQSVRFGGLFVNVRSTGKMYVWMDVCYVMYVCNLCRVTRASSKQGLIAAGIRY